MGNIELNYNATKLTDAELKELENQFDSSECKEFIKYLIEEERLEEDIYRNIWTFFRNRI